VAKRVLTFLNVLSAALLVGAMFDTWLRGDTTDLSPSAYVQHQQRSIRALNVAMPVLGIAVALLTLVAAIFTRDNPRKRLLLVVATCCFVVAGVVTRLLNQPINAIVMTWSPDSPPENWSALRDEWWQWHVLRTLLGICGLSSLIVAAITAGRATDSTTRPRECMTPTIEVLP